MNCKRILVYYPLWALILVMYLSVSINEGGNYGHPGEDFIGIRYPLENLWMVESNPAFIPMIDQNNAKGSFTPNFESSYLTSAYLFLPVRTTEGFAENRYGSATTGIIVHNINISGIEGRGPNNEPLGSFSDSKSTISLLYGIKFTPYLSAGCALKYINYSTSTVEGTGLAKITKSAFGTDLGLLIEPNSEIDLGFSISNMPFQPSVTLVNVKEKWPKIIHMDFGLKMLDEKIYLNSGLDLFSVKKDDTNETIVRPEAGINFKLNDMFMVGTGYANEAFTGGVRLDFQNINMQYSIENVDLGLLHYISLGLNFGSTGYERYASIIGQHDDATYVDKTTPLEQVESLALVSDVDKNIPEGKSKNNDAIAVVIGNRIYTCPDVPAVEYAINDAKMMKEYLIKLLGYKEGNIIYMENATGANIRAVFGTEEYQGNLGNMIKENESDVFIYYSGHGAPDVNTLKGYFLPVDCCPKDLHLNGYSLEMFYESISRLSAKSLTIVIDACFSGGSNSGMLIGQASPILINIENPLLIKKNSMIFASSAEDEISSWYPEMKHGLFTYFFLKGLKGGADENRDKTLTAKEIHGYVTDKTNGVPYIARRIHNGRIQTPTFIGNGETAVAKLK